MRWGTAPFVSVVGLLLLPSFAATQRGIAIGGRAGLNVTSLSGRDVDQPHSRTGFLGGAAVSVGLSEALAIQLEVLRSQKGARLTLPGSDSITYRFNYWEFPLVVRYSLRKGGVSPVIIAGPAVAVWSSVEGSFCCYDPTTEPLPREFVTNPRQTDIGLVLGGAIDWSWQPRHTLSADVRYTLGLRSIDRTVSPVDEKHRAISLALGNRFAVARTGRTTVGRSGLRAR